MNKQWIYRNGEKPFSVTEIYAPNGDMKHISISRDNRMTTHNKNGLILEDFGTAYDLIPCEPYADFKIDDEVYVTDFKDGDPIQAHWSGLDEDGKPTTFINGGTSFTRSKEETIYWKFCEKAKKEDK
jgi:hypothetical protein